jgi:ketosteroid isomerase-like protein
METTSSDLVQRDVADNSEAAEFVRRFEGGWAQSDVRALEALWTDDIVLIQPALPTTIGRQACRKAFERLFRVFPDLHVAVHRWAAHDDVVFIEFTLIGTFGGRPLSWPAVDRIVLRDGLVAERISYFDPTVLWLQVLRRPRGWRRLVTSGLRPSFGGSRSDVR